jgi:hypothetical protein
LLDLPIVELGSDGVTGGEMEGGVEHGTTSRQQGDAVQCPKRSAAPAMAAATTRRAPAARGRRRSRGY